MRLGITEILLILVLALVVFGGSRLAGVGKALGTSIREFKKEVTSEDKEKEGDSEKKAEDQEG
jgi:sec-independent protein translocase protein TatA